MFHNNVEYVCVIARDIPIYMPSFKILVPRLSSYGEYNFTFENSTTSLKDQNNRQDLRPWMPQISDFVSLAADDIDMIN